MSLNINSTFSGEFAALVLTSGEVDPHGPHEPPPERLEGSVDSKRLEMPIRAETTDQVRLPLVHDLDDVGAGGESNLYLHLDIVRETVQTPFQRLIRAAWRKVSPQDLRQIPKFVPVGDRVLRPRIENPARRHDEH